MEGEDSDPNDSIENRPSEKLFMLPAREFIEWATLDPVPKSIFILSKTTAQKLFYNSQGRLFIVLRGKVRKGYKVLFGMTKLSGDENQKFEKQFDLPPKSGAIAVTVTSPAGQVSSYQYWFAWKKIPKQVGVRVRDDSGAVTELSRGSRISVAPHNFVQLYRGRRPTRKLKGESAPLTFRILSSNVPENARWKLVISDAEKKVIGEVSGGGVPPSQIEWASLNTSIEKQGEYFYTLKIDTGDATYEGYQSSFELIVPERGRKNPEMAGITTRFLAGLSPVSLGGLDTQINVSGATLAKYYALETSVSAFSQLSLLLRIEFVSNRQSVSNLLASENYGLSYSALPVSLGATWHVPLSGSRLFLDFDAFAGVSWMTQLSLTREIPSLATAEVAQHAFFFGGKAKLGCRVSSSLSFYLEGGFRFMSIREEDPQVTGAPLLLSSTKINLGGLFMGLGVGIALF